MTQLFVFDIDHTLFLPHGTFIMVAKDGVLLREATEHEYASYTLPDGLEFDYADFRCSRTFYEKAEAIEPMLELARQLLRTMHPTDKLIMLTARQSFDDPKLFIDKFRLHGIDDVDFNFSGDLDIGDSAANKEYVLHRYLKDSHYTKAVMYDDSLSNLKMFKLLRQQYPDIDFEAHQVFPDGTMTTEWTHETYPTF